MKLSIIIAAYNSEKYISKCLDSIVNQSIREKEIIIVNDGSTDQTREIIERYSKNYNFIHVINQDNSGQGVARNKALTMAKGKYITFVDSDDFISYDYSYEKLINECEENELDILIFKYNIIKNNKKISTSNIGENKIYSDDNIIRKFLTTDEIEGFCWNKIFNRKVIIEKNIKFLEEQKFEDIPFVVEAILNAKNIKFFDEDIYNYILHDESTTGNINISNLIDEVISMELCIDKIKAKYQNEFDEAICNFIKKKVSLYKIYRLKNLLKGKLNLKEYVKIISKYNYLLRKYK